MKILALSLHIYSLCPSPRDSIALLQRPSKVAESERAGFLVWGGWESDQSGVKCAAVALINFPPLIVCSRPLRLLGLTRGKSAAQRLCSGFDRFTAPPTADFACNYVCSHTGWKFMLRRKKHFGTCEPRFFSWIVLFEALNKAKVTADTHFFLCVYFLFVHKSQSGHKSCPLKCKDLLKQRESRCAPPLAALI